MNELFQHRAELYFGNKAKEFLDSLESAPTQGLFLNTQKASRAEIMKEIDFPVFESPLTSDSFCHFEENIGKTKAYELGLIYPQEIAASLSTKYIDPKNISLIVDLCAAPGGKTVNIMNRVENDAICICNDVSHTRAQILSSNLERLGLDRTIVTSKKVSDLAEQLEGEADLVILDAPCSGEGMIRKYPEILEEYSLKNIYDLASVQKELLEKAYQILKEGGQLVYSTCTYAPEEDEEQICAFLYEHPDMKLVELPELGNSLLRGTIKLSPLDHTEGQFISLLKKDGNGQRTSMKYLKPVKEKTVDDFIGKNLDLDHYYLYKAKDRYYLSKIPLPDLGQGVLKYGIYTGEMKNGRFEPSHSLYRSNILKGRFIHSLKLNNEEYERFCEGLELRFPYENGYYQTVYHGHSLGFGKLSNGILKNKYPKGLRRVL